MSQTLERTSRDLDFKMVSFDDLAAEFSKYKNEMDRHVFQMKAELNTTNLTNQKLNNQLIDE